MTPLRMGFAGLLLIVSLAAFAMGVLLALGNPYAEMRFPELLLLCLICLGWGMGFAFVALRLVLVRRARAVSNDLVVGILIGPFFVYFLLLGTRGQLLECVLGLLAAVLATLIYYHSSRKT
ncbi:MAG: hypothetical protein R3286_06200 [Gammaproteobacteria bacterium]|nr:hypothetical protein [Gammaproteobacteria bacterium]